MGVPSGFAPSKLFETEVDEDRIKERLAAMRKAAVFSEATAYGIWARIDPEGAAAKHAELLIELVKEMEGLDLAPVLARCPDEVRDAIFDWWSDYTLPEVPPPDGVIDEMITAVTKVAARQAHSEFGSNPERLLDYPQFFLDWVCALVTALVSKLTDTGVPNEVYIQVPNTDIPFDDAVPVTLIWGYGYGNDRRLSFKFNIPWFGRHVVKRDWMAYARLLTATVYEDVPKEFDDEEE